MLEGRLNLRPETVGPETGLIPVPVGCLNLKPGTVRPETGLVPVLVGRILTTILVGGGFPVVHAVVKKARDPLAGVFEV